LLYFPAIRQFTNLHLSFGQKIGHLEKVNLSFLEELLVKQYPKRRVVLVMDNAAYHKSASALAALSLVEHRVMIFWLPPYCSELNPIEFFWRYLKDQACANKLQDNIEEVVKDAEKIMTTQNRQTPDSKFHVSEDL
jgi:transposase